MRMGWARSSGKSRKASPGCFSRRARVSPAVAITSIGVKASKASLDWISTTRAAGSFCHAPPASPSRVRWFRASHSVSAQSTGFG